MAYTCIITTTTHSNKPHRFIFLTDQRTLPHWAKMVSWTNNGFNPRMKTFCYACSGQVELYKFFTRGREALNLWFSHFYSRRLTRNNECSVIVYEANLIIKWNINKIFSIKHICHIQSCSVSLFYSLPF